MVSTPAKRDPLANFEKIVLRQRRASRPWRPVTDYSEEARRAVEGPHVDRLIRALRPSVVLDVGCGPGHLVRWLRARGIDAHGCDLYPPAGTWFFKQDIVEEGEWWSAWYDVVVCREVLEHLPVRDIAITVRRLAQCSSRFIYVTTRFAPSASHVLTVQTRDRLDPTHMSLLNQDFLRALFVLEGCRRRPALERMLDWKHLGRVLVYEKVR